MIEGLRIALPSSEIRAHLLGKFNYHEAKAEAYDRQVKQLAELGDVPQAVTNDPANSLKQSRDTHQKKAAYFKFLADHLVPDEEYRLQEHELERLEWFQRYG